MTQRIEGAGELVALADAIEAGNVDSTALCKGLSDLESCPVSLDIYGDVRFYRWGDEYFAIPLLEIPALIRALVARRQVDA